jgi:hypothetical protein
MALVKPYHLLRRERVYRAFNFVYRDHRLLHHCFSGEIRAQGRAARKREMDRHTGETTQTGN